MWYDEDMVMIENVIMLTKMIKKIRMMIEKDVL
jgi:hypothetical protein